MCMCVEIMAADVLVLCPTLMSENWVCLTITTSLPCADIVVINYFNDIGTEGSKMLLLNLVWVFFRIVQCQCSVMVDISVALTVPGLGAPIACFVRIFHFFLKRWTVYSVYANLHDLHIISTLSTWTDLNIFDIVNQ